MLSVKCLLTFHQTGCKRLWLFQSLPAYLTLQLLEMYNHKSLLRPECLCNPINLWQCDYTGKSGSHEFHAISFSWENRAKIMWKSDEKFLMRISCEYVCMIFAWKMYSFHANNFLHVFHAIMYLYQIHIKFLRISPENYMICIQKTNWQIKTFTFNFIQ